MHSLRRARVRQIRSTSRWVIALERVAVFRWMTRVAQQNGTGNWLLRKILGYNRIYPTLVAAESAIQPYSNGGHENLENIRHHLDLNAKARPSDYAALFHLAPEITSARKIFDLGGNVGNLFYCYKEYIALPAKLTWVVYDLPRNVEHGINLAKERRAEQLRFTTAWEEADEADVLIASGSLHYFHEPLPRLLETLPHKPRRVLVNRTPLTQGGEIAVIQQTEWFRVACKLYNHSRFIQEFERIGYTLLDEWDVPELSIMIPGYPDRSVHSYSGLWFGLVPTAAKGSDVEAAS